MNNYHITGGQTTHGHIVGILMSNSVILRIFCDPGHVETCPFPVIYMIQKGFPFDGLVTLIDFYFAGLRAAKFQSHFV